MFCQDGSVQNCTLASHMVHADAQDEKLGSREVEQFLDNALYKKFGNTVDDSSNLAE